MEDFCVGDEYGVVSARCGVVRRVKRCMSSL